MPTSIEAQAPRTLAEADVTPRGAVYPSPIDWRDQFLYQLLPDRFSDGQEAGRPRFDPAEPDLYEVTDRAAWMAAGKRFNGGTLRGIISKLDYLQDLGVTTIWINPPWKQRAELETYHGYGIQNFLDIDPRFGTRQDLRDVVDAAHERGMYVILDVIFNHSGDNWFYREEHTGEAKATMSYRFAPPYPLHGWRSSVGESVPTPESLNDGVWPQEFQNPEWYTRAGVIGAWNAAHWEDPFSPHVEFRRGDFFDLKDFNLENAAAMDALVRVYQYWIGLSDCDGFRIDAVKHISADQSRQFCTAIREYTESIGKENFLLVGEITDPSIANGYIDFLGRNLDAVLSINRYPDALTAFVTGMIEPFDFFQLHQHNPMGISARLMAQFSVAVMDDHDMVARPFKARFASRVKAGNINHLAAHAIGVKLTTPCIPALYYGTEQGFVGSEEAHDYTVEERRFAEDRYVREAMFGGDFGAFGTSGCHFFNPNHPTYLRIAAIARLRNRQNNVGKTLRRGHLYLRETATAHRIFSVPSRGELVAWSRILFETEVLMVLNTHSYETREADVTVDAHLHPPGSTLTVCYSSNWSKADLRQPPEDREIEVQIQDDGRATVRVQLPPSGMLILSCDGEGTCI